MSLQSKNDIAPFKEVAVPNNLSYHQANTKDDPLLNRVDLRSKFALENAGVGIWEWDISTDELIWSSVMFTLYGYDSHQENISYEFWRSHVHKDDIDETESKIKKVLQDNVKLEMQLFPGFRVLVIEDNLVNQKVLDLLLTQRKCDVQIMAV